MERITATEASRRFSEVLNRARYEGQSFVVERNGEPVAEIRPPGRASTVSDAIDFLRSTSPPDADFIEDMKAIVAERKTMLPHDPWAD